MKVCFFMLGAVFGLEMTRPLSADEVNKCTDLNCLSDIVQDGESTIKGKGRSGDSSLVHGGLLKMVS